MAAPVPNFFGNQFGHIYDLFFNVIAPRLENARQGQHPQLNAMENELEEFGYHLEGHMAPRLEFPNRPESHYFNEFHDIYDTLQAVKDQIDQAIQAQDPNVPLMQDQLRDRLDNLELFLTEQFLRNFLQRGEPLAMFGGRRRRRAIRKSRKSKHKSRKSRKAR